MTNMEKKLLAICVKHLEVATKADFTSGVKFFGGNVTLPETTYFRALASFDSVNRVKDIIKERIM